MSIDVSSVRFFRTETGTEPVREWLRAHPRAIREAIGKDIRAVQGRRPVGMPLVRPLGRGLHEVRTALDGCAYRTTFMILDDTMVLLHAFQKKSPSGIRTAKRDVDLVADRLKTAEREYEEHYGKPKR